MPIAVGILLFVCAALAFYRMAVARREAEKWLMSYFGVINIAAGILTIANDAQNLQIAIGVLLGAWIVIAAVLLFYAARKLSEGSNSGREFAIFIAAVLFFGWVTVFAVLQFVLVV